MAPFTSILLRRNNASSNFRSMLMWCSAAISCEVRFATFEAGVASLSSYIQALRWPGFSCGSHFIDLFFVIQGILTLLSVLLCYCHSSSPNIGIKSVSTLLCVLLCCSRPSSLSLGIKTGLTLPRVLLEFSPSSSLRLGIYKSLKLVRVISCSSLSSGFSNDIESASTLIRVLLFYLALIHSATASKHTRRCSEFSCPLFTLVASESASFDSGQSSFTLLASAKPPY